MVHEDTPGISIRSKSARPYPSPWLLIIGLPVVLSYISIAVQNWGQVFDDAFISYRYAQNLAMGYGITWNPGQPPTEGYTNFLLIVILAPFIKAGLDPLLVTRVLSFICVISLSWILFVIAKQRYHCSATTALMIAALIFLVPATEVLCIVGLETVIYAFFLLTTFLVGVTLIDRQQLSHSILFSCLLFLTMLLRPEAALLYPLISILFLVFANRKDAWKPLVAGLLILLVLGSAYLTWKYLHFGQLIPNPFYLKASGQALISPIGLDSVKSFLGDYALFMILAFSSLLLGLFAEPPDRWTKIVASAGWTFIVVYCLFFTHIDTLMDTHGRFLYPLVPLVILLSIPALAKALGFFESVSIYRMPVLPVIMIIFLFAFGSANLVKINNNIKHLTPNDFMQTSGRLMPKEYRISQALARFPQIKEVRIAFADSGVLPYFSGAIWLDVVGLNDGFIAKTRDKNKLLDYFFNWSPDLVILPGKADRSWFQDGHGPLGDYLSWANDPRWDEYVYAGTSNIQGSTYDLQYFIRKSSRFRATLEGFLKANVVDGWYDPFPLSIGTYHPIEIRQLSPVPDANK
jgi:hypothetical protein